MRAPLKSANSGMSKDNGVGLTEKRPFSKQPLALIRTPMLIGYARVSTNDQTINLQRDALKAAGCARIFKDMGVNGAVARRRGLHRALASLKRGDTLVVWKLDRLGRSLAHLIQTIAELGARGVNFRSLSDPIDTENAGGRLVLHIMAALAEFERSLNSERTRAGLSAAKRRGRRLGRPPKLTPAQIIRARLLLKNGNPPGKVACRFRVARSTLYLAVKRKCAPRRR
jgi:DNA invertase Pin-like site-specific DNA recombinase